MKIKLYTILVFALLCGNSFAQSSSTTVIELMEKSGSTAMFKQFDEIIGAKIAEKKSAFLKEEDFNKFVSAMKSGFNSKNAEKYYLEYFELNTREDSLKSIIHIYESQFMQDMNKIELAASDPAKQQELYSTITLKLVSNRRGLPITTRSGWDPRVTFAKAYRVFLSIFGFIMDILIWLLVVAGPFLLVAWIVWWLFRRSSQKPGKNEVEKQE
jgi:hypothetical protein